MEEAVEQRMYIVAAHLMKGMWLHTYDVWGNADFSYDNPNGARSYCWV